MRIFILSILVALAAPAESRPRNKPRPAKTDGKDVAPEQKKADRHFKSGVTLFGELKFAEALAEFERAYELSPNPIVLYNIASCHRELSHYADAVRLYNRFLAETEGKDGTAARLTAAKAELADILSRIARVTVTVADGANLSLDGEALGTMPGVEMPLIVAPGEHKIRAKLAGKHDAEKTLRVASGDNLTIDLPLVELSSDRTPTAGEVPLPLPSAPARRFFRVHAGFGTNLQQIANSGVPDVGVGLALGSRFETAIDVMLIAYAVMPSVRVRLAGDRASLHLIGALPVAFKDGTMSRTFVAGAGGIGLRLRATPSISFHLDVLASYAGAAHGTTVPAVVGGDLWF